MIITSRNISVCVHALQSVCVAVCFVNCIYMSHTYIHICFFCPIPFPTNTKAEPTTSQQTTATQTINTFTVRLDTFFSQSQVMLMFTLVTLESNSTTIFRHSLCVWVDTHIHSHSTQILCNKRNHNNRLVLQNQNNSSFPPWENIQSCHILENAHRS